MLMPGFFTRILFAVLIGLCLFGAGEALAGDISYVVRRGETLSGIARKHGVSVAALAERNRISKNHYVKAGQRLMIPKASTAGSTASSIPAARSSGSSSSLPSTISSAISNASVTPGRWKYIVIHHSGTSEGTAKGMDRYHREVRHMENGLAYHFVVGNGNGMDNGEIFVGNRWKKQLDGGHLASEKQNKVAIGICLVGNFDKSPPSATQMQSLSTLVRTLMKRCNISASNVKTHQQINVIGTRCPGSRFPTKSFLAGLKS
jgi:murein DD-endopeptidase MepM/ murein hydrolase activator NlpD